MPASRQRGLPLAAKTQVLLGSTLAGMARDPSGGGAQVLPWRRKRPWLPDHFWPGTRSPLTSAATPEEGTPAITDSLGFGDAQRPDPFHRPWLRRNGGLG